MDATFWSDQHYFVIFYIVFSDSRTGLLGLVAGLFFWFLLRIFKSKSVILNLCKVFCIVVITIGANFGFKSLFNYLQEQGITHIEVHTVEDNTFTNFDINQNLNGVATEDKQAKSNQTNVETSKVTTEQQPKENEKKIKQIMLVDPMNINQIFQTDVLIFGRVQ